VNRARGYIPLNGTAVVYGGKLRETSHARVRYAATSVGIRACVSDSGAPRVWVELMVALRNE
jgi:hypothetical protein